MGALLSCKGSWRRVVGRSSADEANEQNFQRAGPNHGTYEEVLHPIYVGEGNGRYGRDVYDRQGAGRANEQGRGKIDWLRMTYVCIMVFFVTAGVICVLVSMFSEQTPTEDSHVAVVPSAMRTSSGAGAGDNLSEGSAAAGGRPTTPDGGAADSSAGGAASSSTAEPSWWRSETATEDMPSVADTVAAAGATAAAVAAGGDALSGSGGPFDCISHAGGTWSKEQAVWCCKEQGVGCPDFDCDANWDQWEKEWSEGKKEWCCGHKGRGCASDEAASGA